MPKARVHNQSGLVLECRLLGSPQLLLDGKELPVKYRKVIALFAFLALEGATSRAKLAGLLWSEVTDDAARRNLRRELHRLKTDLPALNERLEVSETSLQLREPFQSDVMRFETAIASEHVERALEAYGGWLLQNLELEGASAFHEWLEQKRERLERARKRAMLECAELLETRGDWHQALEIHHGLLELDPFQERTHRDLMRLYFLMGERQAALSQFEKCQNMLETELGLEPLPETLGLAARMLAATRIVCQARTRSKIGGVFARPSQIDRARTGLGATRGGIGGGAIGVFVWRTGRR
jgi:DNA-binding SARP family transcriptional activator